MNTEAIFLLGASDPEMVAIRELLHASHLEYVDAVAQGAPVHPGNAYRADAVKGVAGRHVVLVECNIANASEASRLNLIDHHKPGDPGYGRPPEEYATASSIGQVWEWLRGHGRVDGELPADLRIVAAADHCLSYAYQGRCPGVDPEELREWRTRSRAAFQRRPEKAIRADVNAALDMLAKLREVEIGGHAFVDTRGTEIPELPEASAIAGKPVMYQLWDARAERTKVGVLNGNPAALDAWMAWARTPASGLVDVYGDPDRGFAGGYAS